MSSPYIAVRVFRSPEFDIQKVVSEARGLILFDQGFDKVSEGTKNVDTVYSSTDLNKSSPSKNGRSLLQKLTSIIFPHCRHGGF